MNIQLTFYYSLNNYYSIVIAGYEQSVDNLQIS